MSRARLAFLLLPVFVSHLASAHPTTLPEAPQVPKRDATALTLARLSVQALLGSQVVTDAILQGTANYTAGSDEESGSFSLEEKGNQQSKLVLNLNGGIRQEIRQVQSGAWVAPDGQKHGMALHNCWIDASSLLPVFTLSAALNDPQIAAAYLGQETLNGAVTDHIQLSHVAVAQNPKISAQIQQLSAMEIYLDASSHLPLSVTFSTHPDDNLRRSFPVEIRFLGYQRLGGMQAPARVQKFLQGTLTLDLVVTSVVTNSGISDSDFSYQ